MNIRRHIKEYQTFENKATDVRLESGVLGYNRDWCWIIFNTFDTSLYTLNNLYNDIINSNKSQLPFTDVDMMDISFKTVKDPCRSGWPARNDIDRLKLTIELKGNQYELLREFCPEDGI